MPEFMIHTLAQLINKNFYFLKFSAITAAQVEILFNQ